LASKGDLEMAKIKNLGATIVREPETAGAKIERKGLNGSDEDQPSPIPKTAGASPGNKSPLAEPFPARQSDARPVAGKTPRPTDRLGMIVPPKPEPNEEPPVDAPAWTPDVREPDPDLLPDELPLPNPDENRDPPKRALQ
jgi:hypothetical protein